MAVKDIGAETGSQSYLGSMITRMAKLAKASEPVVISATPRDDKNRMPIHSGGITFAKTQRTIAKMVQQTDSSSEK